MRSRGPFARVCREWAEIARACWQADDFELFNCLQHVHLRAMGAPVTPCELRWSTEPATTDESIELVGTPPLEYPVHDRRLDGMGDFFPTNADADALGDWHAVPVVKRRPVLGAKAHLLHAPAASVPVQSNSTTAGSMSVVYASAAGRGAAGGAAPLPARTPQRGGAPPPDRAPCACSTETSPPSNASTPRDSRPRSRHRRRACSSETARYRPYAVRADSERDVPSRWPWKRSRSCPARSQSRT